jgi:spore coat protein H
MKYPDVVSTIGLALLTFGASCGTTEPSATVFRHKDAAVLFGIDHVPRFEFTLPDHQWQWLQAHAVKEQYVRAQARYEGQPAGTIGLRFKGSVGTLANCFDQTGKLICPKLSVSLNFEKYDRANRFFGLKRLNLHSMVADPTKLHERIAYDLYQLSGIKAPRSSWANMNVNGKSYGLFSMVEEVDGEFTADRWPGNGHGNLYKEAWPKTTESAYYDRALETNKDTGTHDAIVAFADDLANSQSSDLSAALGKWTDLPYLARYLAVDDAIANCDGITAMYSVDATNPTSNNHNYYFYQEQHRDLFWLIPWDLDLTLTPCGYFAAVPHWNTPPAHCDRHYQVWGRAWVEEPGCDRLFQAMAKVRADYQAAVDQLLAGPFNEETVLKKIDRWSKFIHDSETADPTAEGEGSWMSAVNELKGAVPVLRERLLAIRDGRLLAPLSLSLTSNNDFETATSLGAKIAFAIRANVNSEVSQEVHTTGVLDGNQDIRLKFVYRDPPGLPDDGWRQWIHYSMTLTNGSHDLTSLTHVRLLLRTDQPRTVRIELESDLYPQSNKGLKFGWEVAVTSSPTPVDLILDNARLPSSAKGTIDALSHVRTDVSGLTFQPSVVGRNASGHLGSGKSDRGYLEIDDLQFSTGH